MHGEIYYVNSVRSVENMGTHGVWAVVQFATFARFATVARLGMGLGLAHPVAARQGGGGPSEWDVGGWRACPQPLSPHKKITTYATLASLSVVSSVGPMGLFKSYRCVALFFTL